MVGMYHDVSQAAIRIMEHSTNIMMLVHKPLLTDQAKVNISTGLLTGLVPQARHESHY